MAVKIRLMRVGKKKQPSYRVVVSDSRSPRDGRIIERIGRYAPREEPSVVDIDADRALDWLRKGAQPSESVLKLLESSGIWDQFKTERPKADVIARRKLEAHKLALAQRPPEPEPEPEAAAEPQPEPEPKADAAATEEPVAEAEAEPEPEPEAATEEPVAEAEAEPEPEPEAAAEEPEPEAEPEADAAATEEPETNDDATPEKEQTE